MIKVSALSEADGPEVHWLSGVLKEFSAGRFAERE
jgi:hypothetical protein